MCSTIRKKKPSLSLSLVTNLSHFYALSLFLLFSVSLINMWFTFSGHQLIYICVFFVMGYELHEGRKGNSISFYLVLKAASVLPKYLLVMVIASVRVQ